MNQNGFKLVQYIEIDGIRNFPDSYLKYLFDRIAEERQLEKLFYDGSIKTNEEFLNLMKYSANKLFLIFCDDEIAGIIWLNGFETRSAVLHFCLFRRFWGDKALFIGKATLNELLYMKDPEGHIFDVLLGLTPANNKLAVRYIQKIGMNVAGELPKAIWDAKLQQSISGVVSYITREEQ